MHRRLLVILLLAGLLIGSSSSYAGGSVAQDRKTLLGAGKVASSTPAFSYTDIGGLSLWLEASGLTGLSNSDPVATFTDLSGNGNDATQSTSGLKPLYKTNIQNGKPAVQFDDTDDGMQTSFSIAEPYTIVMVEKPLGALSLARTLNSSTGNCLISAQRSGNNSVYINGLVSNFAVGDTSAHVLVLRVDASSSKYEVDGVDQTLIGTTHSDWGTLSFAGVGSFSEPGNTNLLLVLVYNSRLSDGNVASIKTKATADYGL